MNLGSGIPIYNGRSDLNFGVGLAAKTGFTKITAFLSAVLLVWKDVCTNEMKITGSFHWLKGTMPQDFRLQFFHESDSPKPRRIPLGPF
jgi:hypothetical protein